MKIARSELAGRVSAILRMIVPILEQAHQLSVVLDRSRGEAADDVREQLTSLLFPGFVAELGSARLRDLPRYLAAAKFRLEALPQVHNEISRLWMSSTGCTQRTTGC